MFLKKETEYALRLLEAIDEGCNAKPLSLQIFAKESGISFLFLQRIASKLKEAGIIKARKGKIGGYWLSKPRRSITVLTIIEAIEGPLPDRVPASTGSTDGQNVSLAFNTKLKTFLNKTTLDELTH